MTYKKRVVDELLARKLRATGAALIEGPKWCGKTTTAEQIAKSILYMSEPEKLTSNLQLADLDPRRLLEGATPRLIDEWQIAPKLWDAVRFEVDHREGLGQFVLTGSSVPPATGGIMHTGTGRFARLMMRSMSLYESQESTGVISLANLFAGQKDVEGESGVGLDEIAFLLCRGGWPRATDMEKDVALEPAIEYFKAIVSTDASRVDGVERNPERVRRLMRSYARLQGTQANVQVICEDLRETESSAFNADTVRSYLNALSRIFVVEEMTAWKPNLRSRAAIRASNTRYFVDPSVAAAALGLGPGDLLNDLNTLGLLFEAMAVRDLRVYADALGGGVYHYRDNTGLECDAVIHLRNGSYGLVEIKLGGDKLVEEGAASLLKLAAKIDTGKMKSPSFLMVLTAVGGYAYRRKDDVMVVPITCLKQ